MDFNIITVESSKDLMRFIKSQWNFYKNDPLFVPPVIADRQKLLDTKKNPFYKHSEIKLFLALSGDEVIGRIAGIVNYNHNEIHKDKVGFFGFFECIDNQEVADALFVKAAEFVRSKGMDTMRGPENPSQNDEVGLLIDGVAEPPMILMTYNPKYYIKLIENAGFYKAKDLYAYIINKENFMDERFERIQAAVRARYRLTIREFNFKDKKQFTADVKTLKDIYNQAWEPNFGFVKMTDEEFDFLAADLKQFAESSLTFIVEIDGEPIGFALGLPDINQVLIHNKNGSLLGALWHLLTKKKRINQLRMIVLGVIPKYQQKGIDAVMYYEMGIRGPGIGMPRGEASWVLEDNTMMNRGLQTTMNSPVYKTYRLYEKPV